MIISAFAVCWMSIDIVRWNNVYRISLNSVLSFTSIEPVIPKSTQNGIVAKMTVDCVIPCSTVQHVTRPATTNLVVTLATQNGRGPRTDPDFVIAITTV